MRKIIIISILALVAALVWIATHRDVDRLSASDLIPAPDFTWQAFDGTRHTLKELSGKPVVLHFWASWCAPCREEFPKLLRAAAIKKNIVFLTVSSDEDKQKAEQFIRQAQAISKTNKLSNVLYAFDPQKTITFDVFQTVQYPETVILDAAHGMRRKFPGPVDWGSEDIQNILKQL
jgi:thiol-disulfide isomerase/thioredoxin